MSALLSAKRACLVLTTLAASFAALSTQASPISIQSTSITTAASVGPIFDPVNGVWDIAAYNSTTNDVTTSVSSNVDSTSSQVDLEIQSSSSASLFDFGFTQTTEAGLDRFTQNRGRIEFIATTDASFSIGGNYDWDAAYHGIDLGVSLVDLTSASNVLFGQRATGMEVVPAPSSVEIGALPSSSSPFMIQSLQGNTSGDLIAGHRYSFDYLFTYASPRPCATFECIDAFVPPAATTALGDLNLTINAKSVPEPASSILLLLGVLGLARARRVTAIAAR